jgi:hypothetical protein
MDPAAVAQSVEQRIRNAKVTSSIPVSGTKFGFWRKRHPSGCLFCFPQHLFSPSYGSVSQRTVPIDQKLYFFYRDAA